MTFNNNNYNNNNLYNAPTYYTSDSVYLNESISKPKHKKPRILTQMIIVALVSSIISSAVVASYFQLISPALNPANNQEQISIQSYDSSSKGKLLLAAESSDSSITDIAEEVSPSIVGIRVTVPTTRRNSIFGNYFYYGQDQSQAPRSGEGSGIIIKSDGYIMTNDHVIADAINSKTGKLIEGAKIEVYLTSKNNKPYTAEVVGRDSLTDLAVIKINGTNFPVAKLGNSDKIKVGDLAIAIGNPGGLEYMGSVTVGVISGLNRRVEGTETAGFKLIQTDAAINPGNSGGALVNSKGEIIGINSVKIVAQGYEGLGFAIPVNNAMEIVNSLIQYKYVKGRIQLGITADPNYTEKVAKQYNMPAGVYVSNVQMLSSAYKAGIRAGDIITKFDGVAVKSVNDINDIKAKHKVGDVVSVEIYRDDQTQTLKVTLAEIKN